MKNLADLRESDAKRRKCADRACPCTAYRTPLGWLCVCCDDELFEPCADCGNLLAWCSCADEGEIDAEIDQTAGA